MAKINETNYPRRQASEYASTDMLIIQPVAIPEQEHSGDSRTTRVDDLKEYIIGDADPSKIGTPAAGTYTSASNTNAQNIAALDNALTNYDHLTKQIATQQEINGYIADPTTASFNVIYLLKDTSATGSDKYYEYMRLGTPQASTFEMTGDTSTDLSDYYTKGEVETALEGKADTSDIPDITGKADKVASATSGNFAGLDSNGNLTDSGSKASDFLTQHQDISGKADKVSGATNGNFAGLDLNGNLTDSGSKASDFLGQVDTMPTASADNYKKIVQYIGATDTYTHGYFYECTRAMGTQLYYWMNISVSEGGGTGGGHTIQDNAGISMTQRDNLQFKGLVVEDDSTNDRTKVKLPIFTGTTVEWEALSSTEKAKYTIVNFSNDYGTSGTLLWEKTTSTNYNSDFTLNISCANYRQILIVIAASNGTIYTTYYADLSILNAFVLPDGYINLYLPAYRTTSYLGEISLAIKGTTLAIERIMCNLASGQTLLYRVYGIK